MVNIYQDYTQSLIDIHSYYSSHLGTNITVNYNDPFAFNKNRISYYGTIIDVKPQFICVEFINKVKECIDYSDILNESISIVKI